VRGIEVDSALMESVGEAPGTPACIRLPGVDPGAGAASWDILAST